MTRIQVYTDENAKQKAFQLRKKLQISNEELQLKHPELFVNPRLAEKAKVINIPIALPKTEANIPEGRDSLSMPKKIRRDKTRFERILRCKSTKEDKNLFWEKGIITDFLEVFAKDMVETFVQKYDPDFKIQD